MEKSYREKLVEFMHFKAIMIEKYYLSMNYFYKEDEYYLLNILSESQAKIIWDAFKRNLHSFYGLNETTCPFCLISRNCNDCFFKENHNLCEDTKSDWFQIVSTLNTDLLFTNKWYQKIINYIEEI